MRRKIKCKENNRLNMREDFISTKAITLITLVITIIILIILAGVIINISIGENGIFNKVKQAKNTYNESVAREKLELVLQEARIDKETVNEYNTKEYLDELLESKGITVNGNEVIVDNYNFKIDRENLTVTESLGETQIKVIAEVQEYLGKNANNKYEAHILLVIESNSGLQKVTIQNPDGTTFEIETDKEKIGKDITVEFDEEYIITVTTKDGKSETRKIIERTEEIIRTAEELAKFRDKVNTPLTYEGKIIKLGRDIDLSSICGENINEKEVSWEPIGTDDIGFHGTFDGQYHTIDNLYINSTNDYQGLFAYVQYGVIKNTIIGENSNIIGNNCVGGIVGFIENTSILNCGNNADITGNASVGGITGYSYGENIEGCYNKGDIIGDNTVGGIAGYVEGSEIKYSYNEGTITGYATSGIVGTGFYNTTIQNSYNKGTINGKSRISGIAGILRYKGLVEYCYNTGEINNTENDSNGVIGGVVGRLRSNDGSQAKEENASTISNSYNSGNVNSKSINTGGILGDNFEWGNIINCYQSKSVKVKYNNTEASTNFGSSSNNYLGILIGRKYIENQTKVENIGQLEENEMPTVYEVVNANKETGLNSGNSEYWSDTEWTDENLRTPKLKWEVK